MNKMSDEEFAKGLKMFADHRKEMAKLKEFSDAIDKLQDKPPNQAGD